MNKRVIFAAAILLAVAVAVVVFRQFGNGRDKDAIASSGNVEVAEANLGFKLAGRLAVMAVDEGDRVAQGAMIAALDNRELKALVEQNRAAVAIAEAEELRARKDYERFESLARQEAISGQQLDAAKKARDASLSQVHQAKAALTATEERLRDTVLHAPITGVVLRKNSEIGEMVPAGAAVYTIGDIEHPWIKVYVKEDKMGLVKYGQKARVTIDSFPDKAYEGIVSFISSEAEFTPKNVQTREERVKLVFGVKVTVENRNGELKPGMPADVEILLK